MASVTFTFYLISINSNVNSHTWLLATVLDNPDPGQSAFLGLADFVSGTLLIKFLKEKSMTHQEFK